MFQIKPYGESDMSPTYVIRRVRELCEGLSVVTGEDSLSVEAQSNATMLFKILVRCAPVVLCVAFRLDGGVVVARMYLSPSSSAVVVVDFGAVVVVAHCALGVRCAPDVESVVLCWREVRTFDIAGVPIFGYPASTILHKRAGRLLPFLVLILYSSLASQRQVRSEMAAKRTLMVYRLNKAAFDYVIGEIHAKFMSSKVRATNERAEAAVFPPSTRRTGSSVLVCSSVVVDLFCS